MTREGFGHLWTSDERAAMPQRLAIPTGIPLRYRVRAITFRKPIGSTAVLADGFAVLQSLHFRLNPVPVAEPLHILGDNPGHEKWRNCRGLYVQTPFGTH